MIYGLLLWVKSLIKARGRKHLLKEVHIKDEASINQHVLPQSWSKNLDDGTLRLKQKRKQRKTTTKTQLLAPECSPPSSIMNEGHIWRSLPWPLARTHARVIVHSLTSFLPRFVLASGWSFNNSPCTVILSPSATWKVQRIIKIIMPHICASRKKKISRMAYGPGGVG